MSASESITAPAMMAETRLSPLKQRVSRYWDANVTNWKIATAEPGSREYFEQIEQYRFSKLDYLPRRIDYGGYAGKTVLDVGCGLGTDLSRFVAGGAIGTGVDISATAVEMSRQNFLQRGLAGEFYRMDGESLDFDDNRFDLVYCHTVFHFTPDPAAMMSEIQRVLKPGGEAIIMTINRNSWLYFMHRVAKMKIDYLDAPVFNKYSIDEFTAFLKPFDRVDLLVERFPVRTQVHGGHKAFLYNRLFVDLYNSLPAWLIGNTGYHLLAFVAKY